MLKRWRVALTLFLPMASGAFSSTALGASAQAPDPRDSVILESKVLAPGLASGQFGNPPAFTTKVYLTNKDTIAVLTLALRESTTVGSVYAPLDSTLPEWAYQYPGWSLADCLTFLKNTLDNGPAEDFTQYDGSSPDRFLVAATFSPTGSNPVRDAEPINLTRSAIWELQFMSTDNALGEVQVDRATNLAQQTGFTIIRNRGTVVLDIPVNFLPGVIHVVDTCNILNIENGSVSVLYGRPFSYDFDADEPVTWSVASGPGSIDPNTGVYSFPGSCTLGEFLVTLQTTNFSGVVGGCHFKIKVIDNHLPVCSVAESLVVVSHGEVATNQITVSDADSGDTVVFYSDGGTINSTGHWSYKTECNGRFISVWIRDSYKDCPSGPLTGNCSFRLAVTNEPPNITCPPDVQITAFSQYQAQTSASDPDPADSNKLIFYWVSGTFGIYEDGRVIWYPTVADTGSHVFRIAVRDGCEAQSECSYTVTVAGRKGDMNGDLELRPADLVLHLNCVMLGVPPPVGQSYCDLNCDQEATVADVVLMINAVYHRVTFPFPC